MPADSVCRAFEKVLTIAPDNVNARMQLVQMLWNEKKYDPVSYTHLDVYKRQILWSGDWCQPVFIWLCLQVMKRRSVLAAVWL